jgi:asparagine synthase (glutamine-hydrolysing)
MRRLSIIDLKTGDQPVFNEDKTVAVVCNGEIYNYRELRETLARRGHRLATASDTEVIAHLYEDHGVECVKYLRGMFAFALWDGSRRRLMLARDRLGIKPLHYAVHPTGLYFGSESKALLAAGVLDKAVDPGALRDLFLFGYATSGKTFFSGIRKLMPGHYLLWGDQERKVYSYWHPDFPGQPPGGHEWTQEDYVEVFREKLKESVRLHMRSDVPVGAWLSPGIDSSSVICLMREFADRPVRSFVLGFEQPEFNEAGRQKTLDGFAGFDMPVTRLVFKNSDLSLFPAALEHVEEPSASGLEVPRLILARATAGSVKVVLTGEGADELLGGYDRYKKDAILSQLGRLPPFFRRVGAAILSSGWPEASEFLLKPADMDIRRYARMMGMPRPETFRFGFFQKDFEALLSGSLQGEEPLPRGFEGWPRFLRQQYFDLTKRLPDRIVHQLDRSTMAYGVEARVPFLDHELVEFCARIPASLKMRGFEEKYILRRAMKGLLPEEIVRRRKHPFSSSVRQWLRSDLPDFAAELLSEDSLKRKGYFDPRFVRKALDLHRAGKLNNSLLLIAVLGVQLWDDIFLRRSTVPR